MQRLRQFLAMKDPAAAQRALKAIRAGINVPIDQSGRPVDDLDVEFREWLIDIGDSGYVVLSRIDESGVAILTVRHQRESDY